MEWTGLVTGIAAVLWFAGWFVGMVNESDEFWNKSCDWSDRRWFSFITLTFFFAGPFTILITRNWLSFASLGRVFNLFSFGVLAMKRKLFTTLFLLALGGYAPNLYERAIAWWQAPAAPMSAEAQRLIASLESGAGWTVDEGKKGLVRGPVRVVHQTLWADVYIGQTCINSSLTTPEVRAINDAAEKCVRKLTAQALGTVAAQ